MKPSEEINVAPTMIAPGGDIHELSDEPDTAVVELTRLQCEYALLQAEADTLRAYTISCGDAVAQLTDNSRVAALKAQVCDLMAERQKTEAHACEMRELRRIHSACQDALARLKEENAQVTSRRIRDLEQDLSQAEQMKNDYCTEAHAERAKAETLASELQAAEHALSSAKLSISRLTEEKNARIVELETLNRNLGNDLANMEQLKNESFTMADTERSKAEANANVLHTLQRRHSSCDEVITKLKEENDRIVALKQRNQDLEQALEETDQLMNRYFEEARVLARQLHDLRQTHLSCEDTISRLTEEHCRIAALKERNQDFEHLMSELEDQKSKYFQKAQDERNKVDALTNELQDLQRTHSSCLDTVAELIEGNRIAEPETRINDLERALSESEQMKNKYYDEVQLERRDAEALTHELQELLQSHSATLQLLKEQTEELNQAQQFLSTTNAVGSADVIQIVERLNDEISYCATHLAESLPDPAVFQLETAAQSERCGVDTVGQPYTGFHRKLIIGIDVGTTFSGVSYSILDPGVVPIIQGVNRFPVQDRVGGDAKIPSVIYYDSGGSVRAIGAEAELESNVALAKEQQWIKVQWFKLHLRPQPSASPSDDEQVPHLPLNKTVVQIFGDFLQYLYQCTRSYIQDTHASGHELWKSLEPHIEYVLTHPNGWQRAQQAQMRSAAIYGGLVPNTPEGQSRIYFMKEGEASLHYCIRSNFVSNAIKPGEGVVIVDAGGGTIDVSTYSKTEAQRWYEEIVPTTCYFQGSVFVSLRARIFLEKKLAGSHYDSPGDLDYMTERFDKSSKLTFKGPRHLSYIRFSTPRETDLAFDVKLGQLRLQGSDVASFFEPSIATARQAIQEQIASAPVPITFVLLVGGFATSNWLFLNLQDYLKAKGIHLFRPDSHLGKVVANGAVSFFVDNYVSVPTTSPGEMFTPISPGVGNGTSTGAISNIWEHAGDAVIRLLEAARNTTDPSLVVQIVTQAWLANYCQNVIALWHPEQDARIERTFQGLYSMICQTATTSVSGKWRGLTKSNLARLHDHRNESTPVSSRAITDMFAKVWSLVSFAGYHGGLARESTDELSRNLTAIAKTVQELRAAIGEMTLTFDMEAFSYPCGTLFNPSSMDDVFGYGCKVHGDITTEPILCTIHLGLRVVRALEDAGDPILLRPRVIVQSVIESILDPGP